MRAPHCIFIAATAFTLMAWAARPALAATAYPRGIDFVCDASESMKPAMPMLRRELERCIVSLRPIQEFNIVLMTGGETRVFDIAPATATYERKRAAIAFLEHASAGGDRGSLAAVDLALRDQPRLVYMLVGRDFPAEAALGRFNEIRVKHKARINFITFTHSTEADDAWRKRIGQIARQTGGIHRNLFINDPYFAHYGAERSTRLAAPVDWRDDCVPDGRDGPTFVIRRQPTRIVYLIDPTPQMLPMLPALFREMQRAIDRLSPEQRFAILFTQPGAERNMTGGMVPATPENKSREAPMNEAFVSRGQVDPTPAIEAAFALHPDLIYFVAGRDFANRAAIEGRFAELNAADKVTVNTIALLDSHDSAFDLIDSLRIIHQQNGGEFRRVNVDLLPTR